MEKFHEKMVGSFLLDATSHEYLLLLWSQKSSRIPVMTLTREGTEASWQKGGTIPKDWRSQSASLQYMSPGSPGVEM